MKNRIVFLIPVWLCTLSHQSTAQKFSVGVRAGVNRGTHETKVAEQNEGVVQTGFTGGAFARAGLLGWFVQPEIMFSQRNGAFETTNGNFINKLNYVDINLMLGWSLFDVVRVNAGPSFMQLLSAAQEKIGGYNDPGFSKDYFNTSVVGLQFGGGVDLGKFCFDIRYDMTLGDVSTAKAKLLTTNPKDYMTGSRQVVFTLGYKIFKLP
jgi:hypothetical protein